jgi:hypothetical protein
VRVARGGREDDKREIDKVDEIDIDEGEEEGEDI